MSSFGSMSRAWLERFLPKSQFVRNVGKLAGGAALGQLVVIATTPITTRLFSPADFGVLAVFTTILGIAAAIISLRYEFAIPLASDDKEAANLLALCLLSCLLISSLFLVIALIWADPIVQKANTPALRPYLWLSPIAILLAGVYQCFNYWLTRKAVFGPIAQTKFSQGLSNAATSITLGLFHLGPLGLLLGQVVGQSAGTTTLVRASWFGGLNHLVSKISWEQMLGAANKYKRFALFSTPSSLLNNIGLWVPPLLFASLYGSNVAGWVSLGDRIARLPLNLIGLSIAQVYYSEAARLSSQPEKLLKLFLKTAQSLFRLSIIPCTLMFLLAPEFFSLAFGSEWRESGIYLRWMALAVLAQFVVNPLSNTLNALHRPDLQAAWDVLRLILVVGGISLSHSFGESYLVAFGVYAASVCLSYAILFLMSLVALQQQSRRGAKQ